jgi:predicted metalloprotease with PDZ domain
MDLVRYAVRVDTPARHTVDVELRFAPPPDADHVDVAMPAWCPGSYLIRDYARFVRDLAARDDTGAPRAATKIDKHTWRIAAAGARELIVAYTVYGHELSVRTNHVDADHAFLHGPALYIFPFALRAAPVEVALEFPAEWIATTSATPVGRDKVAVDGSIASSAGGAGANPHAFRAESIDELYDQPILLGTPRTYTVPARLPCTLAVAGDRAPGGAFDEARLAADLGAIVDDHVARFGAAPFDRYTFLVMLAHDAYGGLEHRASSANLYNPHFGATRKSYDGLLELLSHELFHAWNGKRIAPAPLLDFDYSREAYTPCLWAVEGITSHYDRYALRTSGRVPAKTFLDKVLDDWARLVATPGRARQSLEQSSFDAWIKLYKPDESNLNTTVSYYLKGGLAMLALDLQIRRRTEGARSLDDVMRLLWQRHGVPRVAYPDDLQPLFEEATGLSLADAFARLVRGTEDPDLVSELAFVGLELKSMADPAQIADGASALWLGVTTSGVKVTGVFDRSPAHVAGVSPGDELVAIDGFRAQSDADLRALVGARRGGETVRVALFRRHRLLELPLIVDAAPPTKWELAGAADAGAAAARYQAWLVEPHPGAQVLASAVTTARWV